MMIPLKSHATSGPSHSAMRWTSRHALLVALLAGAVLAAYGQVLRFEFVNLDDDIHVYNNAHLRAGLSPPGLWWALTGEVGGLWIPLTWLSFLLDYQLYGLAPWGYHLTNLLLHTANV